MQNRLQYPIFAPPFMQLVRQHILTRLFWLGMALHLFNCSVDTPLQGIDPAGTYNDMESMVEVFLEKILGIDNAVSEYDEEKNGTHITLEESDLFHLYPAPRLTGFILLFSATAHTFYKERYPGQFHPELIPPPPKA